MTGPELIVGWSSCTNGGAGAGRDVGIRECRLGIKGRAVMLLLDIRRLHRLCTFWEGINCRSELVEEHGTHSEGELRKVGNAAFGPVVKNGSFNALNAVILLCWLNVSNF